MFRDVNSKQAIITGLTPFTKYEILVNPFNKVGPGPASSKAIVSTLEGGEQEILESCCNIVSLVPAAPPDFVQCDPISPNSVSISWKPPPLELSYGIILGYHITYRLENKIGGESMKLIPTQKWSYLLQELTSS